MNLLWSSRCSIYIFNRDRSERQSTLILKDFGCIFIHFRAVDLDQFRVEKQRIIKQRTVIENNLWHWFGRNAFSLNRRNWFKKPSQNVRHLSLSLSRSADQERNILFVFSRVYCSQNMFLILGSGENLSFVLYYELLHSRVNNSRGHRFRHTHNGWSLKMVPVWM